jgi:hypothetical protein
MKRSMCISLSIGSILVAVLLGCGARHNSATLRSPQLSHWRACDQVSLAFECASMTVPERWDSPNGRAIDLGLYRLPSTDPASKGSVVLLPGGPGVLGRDIARDPRSTALGGVVGERSLVLFDDRSSILQAGTRCGRALDKYLGSPGVAEAEGDRSQLTPCIDDVGPQLPAVGTVERARDLKFLVRSLPPPVDILAISYGATDVVQALPDLEARRIVLDSPVNPLVTEQRRLEAIVETLSRALEPYTSVAGSARIRLLLRGRPFGALGLVSQLYNVDDANLSASLQGGTDFVKAGKKFVGYVAEATYDGRLVRLLGAAAADLRAQDCQGRDKDELTLNPGMELDVYRAVTALSLTDAPDFASCRLATLKPGSSSAEILVVNNRWDRITPASLVSDLVARLNPIASVEHRQYETGGHSVVATGSQDQVAAIVAFLR